MTKNITHIFVVGPIGEKGSDTRLAADELRREILEPAAQEAFGEGSFNMQRADDLAEPGRISLQVLQKLSEADVAIVDLAGLNANVMYELGVRQARLKPYILIRPVGQTLPFDIADIRAVDYEFTLGGGKKAIKELAAMLSSFQKSITDTDRLLFGVSGDQNDATGVQQRIQVQMLDQLAAIREAVDVLSGGVFHLMQGEERQRADMAEYRQQELGMRLFEMMANQQDPQAMLGMIQTFSAIGNQATQPPVEQSQPSNRTQRRQTQRRKK